MSNIRLLHGDCYKLIKDIPDNSVDLVYIDIPYLISNMGAGGGMMNNEKRKELYNRDLSSIINGIDWSILDDLARVMKHIYIYIWCSKEQFLDILKYYENKNVIFDLLVWCKTNPTPFCKNTWLPNLEYCFCIREKGTGLNDGYELKSKYYIEPTNVSDKKLYKHPTIKPLELVKKHILHSTKENDVVLDCFMGSGTTGVACKELNRNFIGIELDDEYYDIAVKRINGITAAGQLSIFTDIDQLKQESLF